MVKFLDFLFIYLDPNYSTANKLWFSTVGYNLETVVASELEWMLSVLLLLYLFL